MYEDKEEKPRIKKWRITVRSPSGNDTVVLLRPTITVGEIKRIYGEDKDPESLVIVFGALQVDNDELSLPEVGVKDGNIVTVLSKTKPEEIARKREDGEVF